MKMLFLVPGLLLFVSNVCAAQSLVPEPAGISLDTMTAVGSVEISARVGGGAVAPVLVKQISRVRVGIKKESGHFSDYSYMFITRVDSVAGSVTSPATAAETANSVARVTISPRQGAIEAGLFTMQIFVKDLGVAEVNIDAGLGIVVTPLTGPVLEVNVNVVLPASYYLGQYLDISLPEDNGHTYDWIVTNAEGSTRYGGPGEVKLKTVLSKLGRVEVSLTIKNPNGAVVSRWSGSTNVVPEAPIPMTMKVNQPAMFAAPTGGYGKICWRLDGKELTESNQSGTLGLKFAEKGRHELKCEVAGPGGADLEPMRIVTWSLDVE